jgi:hypothetical protein
VSQNETRSQAMTFRKFDRCRMEVRGKPKQKQALLPGCVHTQNTDRVERKRYVLLTFRSTDRSGGDKVSKNQDQRESDRITFNPINGQRLGVRKVSHAIQRHKEVRKGAERNWRINVEHREGRLGANRFCNPKCWQN